MLNNPVQTKVGMPGKVSPKYNAVSTEALIKLAEELNFVHESTIIQRVNKAERQGFQKHVITLRGTLHEGNEEIPRLTIINSHDGESALTVCLGSLRLACLNGLVFGTAFCGFTARHVGNAQENAKDTLRAFNCLY
jgi:hypothetical protein